MKVPYSIISIIYALLFSTIMANSQNPTRLTDGPTEIRQTAGRDALGDFAPKFAELNDDMLFGQVWSRTDRLSLRDRSIVTVCTLVGSGITDSSLTYHLQEARKNGVGRSEIAEILTHAAFYAGWPKAWAAFRQAAQVWADDTSGADAAKARFMQEMIFPIGDENRAYAKYFIGKSYIHPVSSTGVNLACVAFEPGCRNNWHIHHATRGGGQLLVCVAGEGWYCREGMEPVRMRPGDAVSIPAGVKHWHGATKDSWFAHLAMELPGEGLANEWLEAVDDEQYARLGEPSSATER